MKKLAIILSLIFYCFAAEAQKDTDEFKFQSDAILAVLPVKISGTMNTANSYSKPVYKYTDTVGIMGGFMIHFGMNIPFYRTENWSMGAKINAGVGRLGSFKAAEGLASYILDFPQYLYYRNYASSLDYSVLLGYKYTIASLNYALPVAAIGLNGENSSIYLYGSLKPYTYYAYYTNGEEKPAIQIREFGIIFNYSL